MYQNDRRADDGARSNAQMKGSEDVLSGLGCQIEALTAEVRELAAGTGSGNAAEHAAPSKQEEVKTIDLVGFVFHMFERFWLIVLAAVIGTAGAWFYAKRVVPLYSATAKMYMVSSEDSLINISDLQLGTVLTLDYQEIFKTWEVHELVRKELGLNYTYQQMQSMIAVSNPEDTRILYLTAVHPDPKMAADIANAYARVAKVFIVQNMRGEEPTDFSMALVPSNPINSGTRSTVIKGFLLGSVLMVGLLFVQYILDDRPKTPEDIMSCAGIPTLAILPSVKMAKKPAPPRDRHKSSHQESAS